MVLRIAMAGAPATSCRIGKSQEARGYHDTVEEGLDSKPRGIPKIPLDQSYLPEITVCRKDPSSGVATRECKTTTDLGQALIDGKFDHVGKIKGPILRGLAGRAPYFHNGSAATLMDAVNFYDTRFAHRVLQAQSPD